MSTFSVFFFDSLEKTGGNEKNERDNIQMDIARISNNLF